MRTGKQAPQLVDVLFGSYRRHILALLLLRPGESFYVREIARLTGVPAGSLHRELKLLTSAGLLERSTAGNQVRYQVDRKAPSTRSSPALSQDGWASRARQVPHDSRSSQPPALFRVPEIHRSGRIGPLHALGRPRSIDLGDQRCFVSSEKLRNPRQRGNEVLGKFFERRLAHDHQ